MHHYIVGNLPTYCTYVVVLRAKSGNSTSTDLPESFFLSASKVTAPAESLGEKVEWRRRRRRRQSGFLADISDLVSQLPKLKEGRRFTASWTGRGGSRRERKKMVLKIIDDGRTMYVAEDDIMAANLRRKVMMFAPPPCQVGSAFLTYANTIQ